MINIFETWKDEASVYWMGSTLYNTNLKCGIWVLIDSANMNEQMLMIAIRLSLLVHEGGVLKKAEFQSRNTPPKPGRARRRGGGG